MGVLTNLSTGTDLNTSLLKKAKINSQLRMCKINFGLSSVIIGQVITKANVLSYSHETLRTTPPVQ